MLFCSIYYINYIKNDDFYKNIIKRLSNKGVEHMSSIKEVAMKAGVSSATVSYVLNNTGNVGEQTRKRVLEVIEEVGYVPNRMAKGLRAKKTDTIGILVEDITAFQTPRIINGINEYVKKCGYNIILNDLGLLARVGKDFERISEFRADIEKGFELLANAQVDGIIYVALHDRDICYVNDIAPRIPIVFCYCYDTSARAYCVTYDNEKVTRKAVELLLAKNHTDIGVLCGSEGSKPAQKRFRAVNECLKEHGFTLKNSNIYSGDWEFESGAQAFAQFDETMKKPSAVFCMNDLMAMGFIDAALNKGCRIPEDVSIIGFDNDKRCCYSRPRLTTIDLPLEEMGRKAGNMIMDLMCKKELPEKVVILDCSLVIRDSVEKVTE